MEGFLNENTNKDEDPGVSGSDYNINGIDNSNNNNINEEIDSHGDGDAMRTIIMKKMLIMMMVVMIMISAIIIIVILMARLFGAFTFSVFFFCRVREKTNKGCYKFCIFLRKWR